MPTITRMERSSTGIARLRDPVFPNGCATCEVEVDPDTGHVALSCYASVDDVGRCINPLIVHRQTHGAIVQGVGRAIVQPLT